MTAEDLLAQPDVSQLAAALRQIETDDEACRILLDLCTPREIDELAQRLEVARLLDSGQPYVSVCEQTGASSTTVSRVSKCLSGEAGGYRLILSRLAT